MARSRWSTAAIAVAVIASFTVVRADTPKNSLEGFVKGIDGKPLAHAEVRANRTDAAAAQLVTKTDNNGRYVFTALPAGKYSIVVVPERSGQVAGSATATLTPPNGQPPRHFISALPYQVKADYRHGVPANTRGRMVWKEGEFGSHIGGRWIKASEAADPSTNPLLNLNGADFGGAPMLRVNAFAK